MRSTRCRKSNGAGRVPKSPNGPVSLDQKEAVNGNGHRQTHDMTKCSRQKPEYAYRPLLPAHCAMFVTLLVTLMTMAGRVYYVTQKTSMWILHPDEIYQSLEVAHSEVYGYGFRTYEFLAPAKGDNLSLYQQWEQQRGMYGLRSPLYPRFYVLVSCLLHIAGYSAAPYVIWRVAHVLISSLLPLAVHFFGASLFRSHDVGVVSAMLVASSVHLGVLGTHTLLHSLFAPVLFLALAALLKLSRQTQDLQTHDYCGITELHSTEKIPQATDLARDGQPCQQAIPGQSLTEQRAVDTGTDYNNVPSKSKPGDIWNPSASVQNVGWQLSTVMSVCVGGVVSQLYEQLCTVDVNYRSLLNSFHKLASLLEKDCRRTLNSSSSAVQTLASSPGRFTADSTSAAQNKTTPVFDGGLKANKTRGCMPASDSLKPNQTQTAVLTFSDGLQLVLWSFSVTLCCYIRPDTVLLLCAVAAPYISPALLRSVLKHKFCQHCILLCVAGSCAGLVVGVADDFYFYGMGIASPFSWIKFNVLSNATSELFGTENFCFYCDELFFGNMGMVLLLGMNITGFTVSLLRMCLGHSRPSLICKVNLLGSVLILVALYSFQGHKELRFIHHVIVLYLVLSSASIVSIVLDVIQLIGTRASRLTAVFVLLLFSCSQWTSFPTVEDGSFTSWVYQKDGRNFHVTSCVTFIAQQTDVRGVFFDVNFSMVGGYTMLRHDVPVLALTFTGYHEYGLSSRTQVKRKLWPVSAGNVSVVTSVKISNYFSPHNRAGLINYLVTNRQYNYLVLDTQTQFLETGYQTVFASGPVKVLRRIGTGEEERKLKDIASLAPARPKDGVVEHEARQLYAFGLKELAALRYYQERENR